MENQTVNFVKIITLRQREDGRFQIVGVTDYISENDVNIEPNDARFAVVPDFNEPPPIAGKIAESFFDRETGMVHIEYREIDFSDYPLPMQIRLLRDENVELKSVNVMQGQQITDLELAILCGGAVEMSAFQPNFESLKKRDEMGHIRADQLKQFNDLKVIMEKQFDEIVKG